MYKRQDNGTYIRVAGTSRQAFPEKIKELEMEGARISWDELTCVGSVSYTHLDVYKRQAGKVDLVANISALAFEEVLELGACAKEEGYSRVAMIAPIFHGYNSEDVYKRQILHILLMK